ncbi:4477_t:CDS:1, partial [Acaulospora colombiana]
MSVRLLGKFDVITGNVVCGFDAKAWRRREEREFGVEVFEDIRNNVD